MGQVAIDSLLADGRIEVDRSASDGTPLLYRTIHLPGKSKGIVGSKPASPLERTLRFMRRLRLTKAATDAGVGYSETKSPKRGVRRRGHATATTPARRDRVIA